MLLFQAGRYEVSQLTSLLASVLFQEFCDDDISESESRHVRLRHPRSDNDMLLILHRRAGRRVFDLTVAVGTPAELDGEFPATKKEPAPCDTERLAT